MSLLLLPPQPLEQERSAIRADLLAMGFETEGMLRDVVEALVVGTYDPAPDILRRDNAVDDLEEQIEDRCALLVADRSALAETDLRFTLVALRSAADVERIGDQAVNIAKTASRLRAEGVWYRPLVDLPRLGNMARRMLHDALEALVHEDLERAESVIRADDAVDALYARMRSDLITAMERDPEVVRLCAGLLFVVHYLERVSDHACNVAERLVYHATGVRPARSAKSCPGK